MNRRSVQTRRERYVYPDSVDNFEGRAVWVRGSRTADNLTGLQTNPLNDGYDAFYVVIDSFTLSTTVVAISRK
jgi:hypothetical protein